MTLSDGGQQLLQPTIVREREREMALDIWLGSHFTCSQSVGVAIDGRPPLADGQATQSCCWLVSE